MEFADIVDIVNRRRRADSMVKQAMIDVRDRYNGEWVMPLPDLVGEPTLPATIPALIAEAIDGPALRAASTTPQILIPSLSYGKERGKRSEEYADIRRRALGATWYASQHGNVFRRAYRHLAGYASTALMVMPDFERKIPKIVVRDPLTAYPEPRAPEEVRPPLNIAFVYGRSPEWIHANFPAMSDLLMKSPPGVELWDMVEWIDAEETVWGVLGPRRSNERTFGTDKVLALSLNREIGRAPNRLGYVPAIAPHRVTLDKIANMIANQVGSIDLMARMMALEVMAQEKALFPDAYIVGRQGNTPQIVGNRWKDGREGDINILLDAENVGMLRSDPSPAGMQVIDKLERNFRISSGLVPAQGGETYGSLRTGKGIDSMQDVAVEPRTRELQEIMEYAIAELNVAIFDTYNAYWPGRKYTLMSGWAGAKGTVEFTPDKHFESTLNLVTYPMPGADVTQVTVALGQLVGSEMMSKATARKKHPYVDDASNEEAEIMEEKIEEAIRVSLLQRLSQGGIPPADGAWILQQVRAGMDIADVILAADKRAQERQATATQPDPNAPPGSPVPGAMPGLANPGEGNEQMPPPGMAGPPGAGGPGGPAGLAAQQALAQGGVGIPPPSPSQQNLKGLIRAVTTGAGGTPPAPVR